MRTSMKLLAISANSANIRYLMAAKISLPRVALSPKEFAELFGKSQTWGYRQIYAGKVKTITEYGRILIPAAEVERILGEAGIYNGLPKTKNQKKSNGLNDWRKFLDQRRKANALPQPTSQAKARIAAMQRLKKRFRKP